MSCSEPPLDQCDCMGPHLWEGLTPRPKVKIPIPMNIVTLGSRKMKEKNVSGYLRP